MQNDRIILTIIELYRSIMEEYKNSKQLKIIKKIKCRKRIKKLKSIINGLHNSDIILNAISVMEFTSYIQYASDLDSYKHIKMIKTNIRSEERNSSVILMVIVANPFEYNITLNADKEELCINMKKTEEDGTFTSANMILRELYVKPTKGDIQYEGISFLNKVLIDDIRSYLLDYIGGLIDNGKQI